MLPLTSMGLFPFYQYSSTTQKFQLLLIFQAHFIHSCQCLQMITSLVNTLLTSFIQNNEQLNKRVFAVLAKIGQRYGRTWVDGAVWVNVLKSPKVRAAGYKYFMREFKERDKVKEDENQVRKRELEERMKLQEEKERKAEELRHEETKIVAERSLGQSQELQVVVDEEKKEEREKQEEKQRKKQEKELEKQREKQQKQKQKQQKQNQKQQKQEKKQQQKQLQHKQQPKQQPKQSQTKQQPTQQPKIQPKPQPTSQPTPHNPSQLHPHPTPQPTPRKKSDYLTEPTPTTQHQAPPRKRSQYRFSDQNEDNNLSDEDVLEFEDPEFQVEVVSAQQLEKLEKKRSREILGSIKTTPSITNDMFLDQVSGELREQITNAIGTEDGFKSRFPNFSTLVVNAIAESLQSQTSDNLIRRSALDMMILYFNMDGIGNSAKSDQGEQDQDNKQAQKQQFRQDFPQKDLVYLTSIMLQMINYKQYSLTRRVYTYLFGPPNDQGIYIIDPQTRQPQLQLLQKSIQKLLKTEQPHQQPTLTLLQPQINPLQLIFQLKVRQQKFNKDLNPIYIILKDNPELQPIILPLIAYRVMKFLRINADRIGDGFLGEFYGEVVEGNMGVFLGALEGRVKSRVVEKRPPQAREAIMTIQHFYVVKNKMKNLGKKNVITQTQIHHMVQLLLQYLLKTKCSYQRLSIQVLDLCNRLTLLLSTEPKTSPTTITLLNQLIALKPLNTIYARLLNFHPQPSKQDLFPYLHQSSLSTICIRNLLAHSPQSFTQQQKKQLFLAIFALFRFSIWHEQAVGFVRLYQEKFGHKFERYIDEIQPGLWLIYWEKMNGNVSGGILRMLEKIQSGDKENRQQLKKWLEDSKHIPGRILDPVYALLRKTQNKDIQRIYRMIRRIYKSQRQSFSHFLFKQRQKYLMPLLDRIFDCIQNGDQSLKMSSVQMLQFIIQNIFSLDQKLIFMSITFRKTIQKLHQSQKSPTSHQREAELIEYFTLMANSFSDFKDNEQRISILQQIIEGESFIPIMADGMRGTQIPYIRKLYMQLLEKAMEMFLYIGAESGFVAKAFRQICERLFEMLKENNVAGVEEKIAELTMKTRKVYEGQGALQFEQQPKINKNQINIQTKYKQIMEIWNCISTMFKACIQGGVTDLPVLELLALVGQVLPFGVLKYEQISDRFMQQGATQLQNSIRNTTGLKKQVLSLFTILLKHYPTKILDTMLQNTDPRLLLHNQTDLPSLLPILHTSTHLKSIQQYYSNEQLSHPKNVLHYNTDMLRRECQFCYFLYVYLAYCELDGGKIGEAFCESFLRLLREVGVSRHVEVKLWLVEIVWCFVARVDSRDFGLKGVYARATRFRSDLHKFLGELLDQITLAASKKRYFTTKIQIKSGILHRFNKSDLQLQPPQFDFVRPFPPTIAKQQYLYQNSMKNLLPQHTPHQDQSKQFIFTAFHNNSESRFRTYLSAVCLKTYSSILYPLLVVGYEKDYGKVANICKGNLGEMFDAYEENVAGQGEKVSQEDIQGRLVYQECFAQFVRQLVIQQEIKKDIIKGIRKDVIQIFMSQNFFKCTKNTLNYWKPVIDECTEQLDLLSQLIPKQGLFQGVFSRKNKTTQVQIKNFQRVCYLIFCGQIDKYDKKLRTVLQSLSKVMKAENPSPTLLILILFCLRILFMRLSQASLNRIFRSIWPSMIALLIQIFSKKRFEGCVNLYLAGLKIIEEVHALELEEFNIHKWMFVFDYFGIRIQEQSQQQRTQALHNSSNIITPFKYKPILFRLLTQKPLKCTYIPTESLSPTRPLSVQAPAQTHHEPERRRIIITETLIQTQEQLQDLAYQLIKYMIGLNQRRVRTYREDIEDLIQGDLLSLDLFVGGGVK